MPTYRLVETTGVVARFLRVFKMCFLNVLRLHVSQNQRQKRLYKQYMEQLAGAYVERCTELSPFQCDRRFSHRVPTPEWRYNLSCDEHYWYSSECSRSCCGSECSDSGRCSSPCCSEVIFNGGQHFSGKRTPNMHVCHRLPICYPGSFGFESSHWWIYASHPGPRVVTEGPPPFLPLPFSQLRAWMRQRTFNRHNERWAQTAKPAKNPGSF